ncbi:MAG: hypothetical protein M1819_007192 [Sarea resinae]|nr:MAG: hypothetical protein M1819_007192 [Sarea resinae]
MPDQPEFAADSSLQEEEANRETSPFNDNKSTNPSSAAHKRKRDPSDHDGTSRNSTFKRSSPKSMAALPPPPPHDSEGNNSTDLGDPSAASFLSAHNASSGSGDDDMHHSNASLDFSALTHHHSHDLSDHQNGGHHHHHADPSQTAAAALAGIYPSMTVPQATEISFASSGSGADGDHSFSMEHEGETHFNLDLLREASQQQQHVREPSAGALPGQKPAVGSEEWHKVRRDNHKEVERRRRETINEGINELAKIVPGCEKNKGSILQRAVRFITQLKENESQNIEKWTLEKLLTEQAISELSASVDKLKNECERAWREAEMWKKTAMSAGITAPKRGDDHEGVSSGVGSGGRDSSGGGGGEDN